MTLPIHQKTPYLDDLAIRRDGENPLRTEREEKKILSSATQAVLDYVRTAIRQGQLEPGQRVRERELVEKCDVSRSAIREALRTLEAEGTLHREPGHSATVRQYTLEEVWCHNQIREVLEGLAANLAARRDEVRYHSELSDLEQSLCDCASRGDLEEYLKVNRRLHNLIQEMSGNPLIQQHLDSAQTTQVRMHSERFWDADGMQRSLAEHRRVISAILSGNAIAAESAMRDHIRSGRRVFLHMPADVLPPATTHRRKRP